MKPALISLTIVTLELHSQKEAEELADLIKLELGNDCKIYQIAPYTKFDGSFKIELELRPKNLNPDHLNLLGIQLTGKLVSPWLIWYDNDSRLEELIFNHSENAQFCKVEFQNIRWAHWQPLPF